MNQRGTGPSFNSNIDPVCGKRLDERDPQRSELLEGQMLFFCSRECQENFAKNVKEWAERSKAAGVQF